MEIWLGIVIIMQKKKKFRVKSLSLSWDLQNRISQISLSLFFKAHKPFPFFPDSLTSRGTLHMHHTSYRTEINSSSRANEKFLGQDISAVYQGALRRGMILLYEGLLLIIHPICGRNSQCEYWLWQALLSSVDSESPESQPDLSKTVWAEVGEGLTDWLPAPDHSEPIPSNNASGHTHIFRSTTRLRPAAFML